MRLGGRVCSGCSTLREVLLPGTLVSLDLPAFRGAQLGMLSVPVASRIGWSGGDCAFALGLSLSGLVGLGTRDARPIPPAR